MKKILFIFSILLSVSAYSTHTFGGYISYNHISGNTYEISVHLFQDLSSPATQRREIEINYGDNSGLDTILRTAQLPLHNSTFNIEEMVYTSQHTYSGFGQFTISVEDPNRPFSIINIANSQNEPVYLQTGLEINPAAANKNNSPILNSNLVIYSESAKDLRFNLSAFDVDGDFLTYKLIRPRGANGSVIPSYSFPSGVSVDEINGEFRWNNPPAELGFHHFSLEITECRNNRFIATTTVDFMIYNTEPSIDTSSFNSASLARDEYGNISYIIEPGDSLALNIDYQSTDSFSLRLIDGTNRANYDINGSFKFVSKPEDNRCAPYLFIFEADIRGVLDHETVMVRVIDTNLINCDTICGYHVLAVDNQNLPIVDNLKVRPNPFVSQTSINLPTNFKVLRFSLYNKLGQINTVETRISNRGIELQRSNLPSGVYFYRILGENNKVYSGKLIAQ